MNNLLGIVQSTLKPLYLSSSFLILPKDSLAAMDLLRQQHVEWQQSVTALLSRVGQISTPLTEKARRSQGTILTLLHVGVEGLIFVYIFEPCDMVHCFAAMLLFNVQYHCSFQVTVLLIAVCFFTEIIIYLLGSSMA